MLIAFLEISYLSLKVVSQQLRYTLHKFPYYYFYLKTLLVYLLIKTECWWHPNLHFFSCLEKYLRDIF